MNSEVIAWLESPEGEEWSRERHKWIIALATVKTWSAWLIAELPAPVKCEIVECNLWYAA